jgi:predicted transcriptional regulator
MASRTQRTSSRQADVPVRDSKQIAALRSPARQEVVDGLQAIGPCSIADLAESLGRAPDSLYYHVRKLESVGLVVQRGTQGEGVRREVLYDTPGRLIIDHEPSTSTERKRIAGVVASALRIAERDLRAALEGGIAVYRPGARRNAWGARTKGWLSAEELAQVREHLDAVSRILVRGRKRAGTALHSLAFVLAPLVPSPRCEERRRSPSRKRP